jgi:LmbE family N-acetylglucosaminyl deacetylase
VIDRATPDLSAARRILCVQPHPDDTDIALGATIAMLADRGADVIYCSVTDDAAGLSGEDAALPYEERVEIRRAEQRAAADRLGVADVIELGFPDAGEWSVYDARNAIVEVIRRIRPDTLLTVDPWMRYEAHADHRRAGYAAAEAAILHDFPAVGGTGTASIQERTPAYSLAHVGFFFTDNPNVVLDAQGGRERKLAALADHRSQWDDRQLAQLVEYDSWRAERYGRLIGASYAEALLLVPLAWLHVFPDLVAIASEGLDDTQRSER